MSPSPTVLLALSVFTAAAAYVDVRTGHIPNRLVLVGLLGAMVVQVGVSAVWARPLDQSWPELLARILAFSVLGLLVCALIPLLLFRANAMGGGDVKLLAAVGASAGPMVGLQVELYAFALITLYALGRLAYEGQLLRLLGNSAALVANFFLPKERRRQVPQELMTSLRFGPAVFVATFLVTLIGWWEL